MIEFDSFIYLDCQKTASRWILKTLTSICGKPILNTGHNPLEEKSDKPTLISIRNPFDTYVSTYSYGGGPASQWPALYLLKTGKKSRLSWNKGRGSPQEFKWYVQESREMWPYLGLESQRFFRMALGLQDVLIPDPIPKDPNNMKVVWMTQTEDLFKEKSLKEILKLEKQHRHYTHVVAVENLENDLVDFITDVNPKSLVSDWQSIINKCMAIRYNTSSRILDYTHYYDAECIELVSTAERFLLERFGYTYEKLT